MLSAFIHSQYCYDYLVNQIPMGLLLYSHIPTALVALAFGAYVLYKARNLSAFLFFNVCLMFTIWAAFDLSAWFAFLGADNVMFTWSLLDFFAVMMFFFTFYFLYNFTTGKDLPLWLKLLGVLVLIPTTVVAFLGINIPTYDLNSCIAVEDNTYTIYTYIAEGIYILATIIFLVVHYLRNKTKEMRSRTVLAGSGVLIFFGFFFSASFMVSLFAASDISSYVYNYLIYGLFGMPIFLIYLGYLIVRYHAFDLRMFGAQALVWALIAIIAAEFAFVSTLTNRVLVAVTLVLTAVIGTQLIRSVKKEIEQRQRIEKLANELAVANDNQVTLIHFITHQIKGFVAKSRNIFSMALEGDFGPVGDQLKPMLQAGFESDTKGAETIQEILNASNIKSGKVTYKMEPFDLKGLITEIIASLQGGAATKGILLKPDLCEVTVTGDRAQLTNAFKNLIDNSIKYTPTGEVDVGLKKEEGKVVFTIKDTGVGITPDDMKNLFTEGGHGKESTKINVESTGFGLYIVKNIIDAHKGKVWAESEGAGKGSKFIVELPS